ncbi:hypothetical protein BDZ97DRAFT_1852474 [Flammula alnicola]|nr:hypothetical protein BDZ97DRAFT_1852474 [Flammula alnicola]
MCPTPIISDEFEASVKANMDGLHPDDFLVQAATEHLGVFKAKPERLNAMPSTVHATIDPARVLDAMLRCSSICGSRRYAACCIVSCAEKVEELVELSNTWVRYFLWPYRRSVESPEHAIRTVDVTSRLESAAVNRRSEFAGEVLARDGYRCVVTGFYHVGHVPLQTIQIRVELVAAHILKRAVAVFQEAKPRTVSLTWDIIKQYSGIPDAMIDTMNDLIDDPQNGITLEKNAHDAFDSLAFALIPQDDGSYKIEQFGQLIVNPLQPTIRFNDHSPPPGTSLPNRKFLALHAAIASVLHMSGAGAVLDLIMDKFSAAGTPVPSGKRCLTASLICFLPIHAIPRNRHARPPNSFVGHVSLLCFWT